MIDSRSYDRAPLLLNRLFLKQRDHVVQPGLGDTQTEPNLRFEFSVDLGWRSHGNTFPRRKLYSHTKERIKFAPPRNN